MPTETETRSAVMSRIRSKDTEPELLFRKALWATGLRYRTTLKGLGCRPDIVFPRGRLAIFVDGCFWHGCPEHYVFPRTNQEFWSGKLEQNLLRDRRQTADLEASGWRVMRLLEHQVFTELESSIHRVIALLNNADDRNSGEFWRVISVEDCGNGTERRVITELRSGDESVVVQQRTTKKWIVR